MPVAKSACCRLRAGGDAMRAMREGLARLSEDVHAPSYRLHPSIIEDLGLIEALKSECQRFSELGSPRVECDGSGNSRTEPPRDVALCLFRVAQEALQNVAHHSAASAVQVTLRCLEGGLQLRVHDDGKGFDPTGSALGQVWASPACGSALTSLTEQLDIESA